MNEDLTPVQRSRPDKRAALTYVAGRRVPAKGTDPCQATFQSFPLTAF